MIKTGPSGAFTPALGPKWHLDQFGIFVADLSLGQIFWSFSLLDEIMPVDVRGEMVAIIECE